MNDNFQNKINEIKEKADIVDIIGEHVHLEKQGANYVGLCPFHEDKNPSLIVSPTKRIFKCFSCNESGNAISFIEKFKKISFMEALREVGNKVGVVVAPTKSEIEFQQNKKYFTIMTESCDFYHFYLKNTFEGQSALQYLQNRKIDKTIINRFKIGLSGSEPNLLFRMLTEKGHLPIEMVDVGLVKSGNEYYDTFRKRIMFPITDLNGNIVGFSGRKYLPNSDEAKYVNSNENRIFKKGEILYNFHEAFNDIKNADAIFVFEGFMDVIAAYKAKVYNAVATMGTALTVNQIKAIKRVTNNVILCYDGDVPGIEATKRALRLFFNHGIVANVIMMPDDLDPDEYLDKYGEEALRKHLLNESVTGIEYIYQLAKKDLVVTDLNSLEKFKNEVFTFLRLYNSSLIIEKTINKLSEDLKVSPQGLMAEFSTQRNIAPEPYIPVTPTNRKIRKSHKREAIFSRLDNVQKQLINIALTNPNMICEIESRFNNHYVNAENRDIMLQVHQYYSSHKSLDKDVIKAKFSPNTAMVFEQILNMELPPNVTQVDVLFKEFDKYPDELLMSMLLSDEKTVENCDKITKLKKSTTIIRRGDSND